ncbi:GNAT family N-acetyltransferase [Aestuariibacter salexigens]|uniref:GNAT family N-acetyltransferase n=1 Tax=Aestuariibacter salexigens TaxID=226010 RepID=UPI00041EA29C|nr:GNAT family N-acetyltransferase [Aestuariibacter salexigens]
MAEKIEIKQLEARALGTEDLKRIWSTLFQESNASTFLSWPWIKAMLKTCGDDTLILVATLNVKTVGCGIVSFTKGINTKKAFLHRSGKQELDQVWTEYNDFLLHKDYVKEARLALIDYCVANLQWNEFVIGASCKDAVSAFKLHPLIERTEWLSQCFYVNLVNYKSDSDYLASLSRNTRYQIKRSLKEFNDLGTLSIERADSTETALSWISDAAPHHIKRWTGTRVGSGFTNPQFVQFHERFIRNAFEQDMIDILRISAGDNIISYLYNFVEGPIIRFYLSSNVYENDASQARPGLVAHFLAIRYYLNAGKKIYDFMGGESRYKLSLSDSSRPIELVRFYRDNFKNKLLNKARVFKSSFRRTASLDVLANTQVILSGGSLSKRITGPTYDRGIIAQLNFSERGECTYDIKVEYSGQGDTLHENTNRVFKSASVTSNNALLVPTETTIKKYDLTNFNLLQSISHPTFNDIHHVIQKGNIIYAVNTGRDEVIKLDEHGQILDYFPTVSGLLSRPRKEDYRLIPSTKPHIAHPNYCFELDNEVWVTRCDFMDAIKLSDPNERIFIGDNLVHDGVLSQSVLMFTTVNGLIKCYDARTRRHTNEVNLAKLSPHIRGWYRGICALNKRLVVVGVSALRSSKRVMDSAQSSQLLVVDLVDHKIVSRVDLSPIGLDAIFGVIKL